MDQQEFTQRLARKELPSVLFFEGPEEHLKQEALQALRKAMLPEGLEDLNEVRLTAPEVDDIIAACETLPLMADQRLILLRDYPAIVGRAEADDKLLSYLSTVPPTAVLLFYCVLPTKQKKIRTAVQKLGGLVEFKPLKSPALSRFVIGAFHDLGRECDERTADYLVFTVGNDTGMLLQETAKIAAAHPEVPAIHPDDIRTLATPSTEAKVFSLTDAVVAGQQKKAFQVLKNLLLNGEPRARLLFMIERQFRLLQQVKILQYEHQSPQRTAEFLGLSKYTLQQYLRQAESFSGPQIREAVALCLETDLAIKSGELREEGALEALLLKLMLLRSNDQ